MGTYNNEEQERLSDIALAFSDTTELDNIVSSSPIMKDFSAQSMYNKLTNVEDAMEEDTSELVFDSEGIPFDPNLPRFDKESGVQIDENGIPLYQDPSRNITPQELVNFEVNQTSFFDELTDSPEMFFKGFGHGLYNTAGGIFGSVYQPSDAGADSITDQVAYQVGVGGAQAVTTAGFTTIGGAIGSAFGPGGTAAGAKIGMGLGVAANTLANREVEKQSMLDEGSRYGMTAREGEEFATTTANKVMGWDLLQEGLPLAVYGKGLLRSVEAKQAMKAAKLTEKSAANATDAFKVATAIRGREFSKEIMTKVKPYLDSGLLKMEGGVLKVADKKALTKLILQDTLKNTLLDSTGESVIEVIETITENKELNEALGYEAKDIWEGTGEAALVAGLASGISSGGVGLVTNMLPVQKYNTTMKSYEKAKEKLQKLEQNIQVKKNAQGDTVVNEKASSFTGDSSVEGTVQTDLSNPLKSPVIVNENENIESNVDVEEEAVSQENVSQNKNSYVKNRKLRTRKDLNTVVNTEEQNSKIRAAVRKQQTNDTDQQIEFKKDMKGSGDNYNFQQSVTNEDDTSVDKRIELAEDSLGETIQESLASLELNEQENLARLKKQNEQAFEGDKFKNEDLHYTIKEEMRSNDNLVSTDTCKVAAQHLMSKLGIKMVGNLEERGKEGKKVSLEENPGVGNVKAKTIILKNAADVDTMSHEITHHVYDDVLDNMKDKKTLNTFNKDVKTIYKKIKNLLSNKQEIDTTGLNDQETVEEMYSEIIAAYTTHPIEMSKIVGKYKYMFDAFEQSLNQYEGGLSAYNQFKQVVFRFNTQPSANQAKAHLVGINNQSKSERPFWAKIADTTVINSLRKFYMYKDYRSDVITKLNNTLGQIIDNNYMLNKEIDRLMKMDSNNQYLKTFETIVPRIRLLMGSEMDTLTAFIAGNGMTFSSRSEIHGFKNLLEIRDSIDKFATDNNLDISTNQREFAVYLIALNTIGENLGNDAYVTLVHSVSGDNPRAFIEVATTLMMLNTKKEGDESIDLWNMFIELDTFDINNERLTHIFDYIRNESDLRDIYSDKTKYTNQYFIDTLIKYKRIFANNLVVTNYASKHNISINEAINTLFRRTIEPTNTGLSIVAALREYNRIINDPEKYAVYYNAAKAIYDFNRHVSNYMKQASTTTKIYMQRLEATAGAFHIPLIRNFVGDELTSYLDNVSEDSSYVSMPREGSDRTVKDLFDSIALQTKTQLCKAHTFSCLESIASLAGYGKYSEDIISANYNPVTGESMSSDEAALTGYGHILQRILPEEQSRVLDAIEDIDKQIREVINKIDGNSLKTAEQKRQEKRYVRAIENYVRSMLQVNNPNPVEDPFNTIPEGEAYNDIRALYSKVTGTAIAELAHIFPKVDSEFSNLLKSDTNKFSIYDANGDVVVFQVMDKKFLSGVVKFALTDLLQGDSTGAVALKTITVINNKLMHLTKMFYTSLSLPFVLFTNSTRDMTELMIKNPLYKNSELLTFSQIKEVFQTYIDTMINDWLIPGIKGIVNNTAMDSRLNTLDKLGLGFNTSFRTIYDLNEFKHIEGELVPRSRWGQFMKFLEASDKIGRYTQLKLLMKNDGIDIDAFEVSRENLAGLDGFSKKTLAKNGLTESVVKPILTQEQAAIWDKAGNEEFLQYLNLSEDQYAQLYNYLQGRPINELSEEFINKYAKILRECTTDFARGSAFTREMNRYFMFFGARLNGMVEYGRWVKQNPRRAAGIACELIVLGALTQLSGLLLEDDDEMMQSAIRFKIGNTIFKIPVSNEPAMAFNLGRVAAKFSPKAMGDFIKMLSFENTMGLFNAPRGLVPAGLALVQGLTGANTTKFSDVFSGYSVHSAGDWYRFKDIPSKLLGPNVSTLSLALNRIIPGVSPSMWDYVLNDVIGFGSVASASFDAALNSLSYFGPNHDLYNYIRVQLNDNVTPIYTRKNLREYLFPLITPADKYVYTKQDRDLKKLFSVYVSDYYNNVDTVDGKPHTPEQENLYNKYNLAYEATQLLNVWYRTINITQDSKERLQLIKQKDKMVKEYLDELNNSSEFTKERKQTAHKEVTKMRNEYKDMELARKAQLLGKELPPKEEKPKAKSKKKKESEE